MTNGLAHHYHLDESKFCNEPGYRYHNMDIKYIDFSQGLSVQITEVATQL